MLFEHIIAGSSKSSEALRKKVSALDATRAHILLIGEAGTGKTHIAKCLGAGDSTAVTIDLATLTEETIGSALHEVTAGTVIFEGLEHTSLTMQTVLSHLLDGLCTRARVIVTMREKAAELAGRRRLVDEIYSKLLEFEEVEILPLRKRPEDIPALMRQIVPDLVIDINTLDALMQRSWRENVRELRMVVQRSLATPRDGVFMLPQEYVEERTEVAQVVNTMLSSTTQGLDESLDVMERSLFGKILEKFGFSVPKAARHLGMSETALNDKLHQLALVGSRSSNK